MNLTRNNLMNAPNPSAHDEEPLHPSPADFETFLPWACKQYEVEYLVVVKKQDLEPLPHKQDSTHKVKKTSVNMFESIQTNAQASSSDERSLPDEFAIIIDTVYSDNQLTQIGFRRSEVVIPVKIFKIINIIIQFHPFITRVTINHGLTAEIMCEFAKMLPISNITDLILDGGYFKQGNYAILLDDPGKLAHLSLARCTITDSVAKALAEKLVYPLPASKCLQILNLSSNLISDVGARALGNSLRTNRKLKYLNLAHNMITDTGAEHILASLKEFALTEKERINTKQEYMAYVKRKLELMKTFLRQIPKTGKDSAPKLKKPGKEKTKTKALASLSESSTSRQLQFLAKAEEEALELCGIFDNPFRRSDVVCKNDVLYSCGNTSLCYLNLSYNQLSYSILNTVVAVLKYQIQLETFTPGLISLRLDGNPMPVCEELENVQHLLEWQVISVCAKYKRKHTNKIRETRLE